MGHISKKHQLAEIRVVDIVVAPERMRGLRPEAVDVLAESIAGRGLLQPIVVRPRGAQNFWLVFGRHRLEAVRKCGHTHIRANIIDGSNGGVGLHLQIGINVGEG